MSKPILLRLFEPVKECGTCLHFADHSDPDDDPDEVNGYCCHPNHRDRKMSPHYEYGGHWSHTSWSCGWWEMGPSMWVPVQDKETAVV